MFKNQELKTVKLSLLVFDIIMYISEFTRVTSTNKEIYKYYRIHNV